MTGSFVYYYACQENLTFVTSTTLKEIGDEPLSSDILELNTTYSDVSFEYKPGFKVELGFNFGCDDWAFYTEYLRYHAKVGKGSFSATAPKGVSEADSLNVCYPWNISEDNEGMFRDDFFDSEKLSATSSVKLDLDIVDFTLGRNFYVGKCLTFIHTLGYVQLGSTKNTK